jgi:AraC family transcriptional regulator
MHEAKAQKQTLSVEVSRNMSTTPHLGHITLKERAGAITLTRVHYAPGALLPKHAHDKACFALIQAGGYTESFGARRFLLRAGTVLFRPAHEEHVDEFVDAETSCLLVEVNGDWLNRVAEYGPIKNEPLVSRGPRMALLAADICVQAECNDTAATLAIEGLSYALGAELLRQSTPKDFNYPPRWLRQVHQRLSEDPCNKFELGEIAAQVDIHPHHVSRQFRRFYGENLWEFVRRRRIEVGANRIVQKYGTLGEIAESVGFTDQSQFTRAFREIMGMTPSTFRSVKRTSTTFC